MDALRELVMRAQCVERARSDGFLNRLITDYRPDIVSSSFVALVGSNARRLRGAYNSSPFNDESVEHGPITDLAKERVHDGPVGKGPANGSAVNRAHGTARFGLHRSRRFDSYLSLARIAVSSEASREKSNTATSTSPIARREQATLTRSPLLYANRSRLTFISLFVGLSACSSGSGETASRTSSGGGGGRDGGSGGAGAASGGDSAGGGIGGRTVSVAGAGGVSAQGGTGAAGQGGGAGMSGTATVAGSSASGGPGAGGMAETGGSSSAQGGVGGGPSTFVGPCDVLETGHAPCVAAHSTVRLLARAYNGPLYQVRRASDSKTLDIAFLAQSGTANSAAQETFCASTQCTISVVYDQSGKGNHLTKSLGGGEVCRHQDQEAIADALPLMLGGHKVYAIKVVPDSNGGCTPPAGGEGTGYRLDKTTGIATGDDAETEYMVTSGSLEAHGNSGCCFDYGNVETNDKDDGAATMEALYFGGGAGWGRGGGNGPWAMADMENGIFSGATNNYTGNTSVPYPYVTAVLIGRTGGTYALMAGNAQTGDLMTMYDGPRPNGYTKMKKQGAIVLGTGGDNSDHGQGYFFEGVMTAGAASTSVMSLVHANILAAGYGK